MTAPLEELARRLVATKRCPWMPGMVDTTGRRVVVADGVPVEWAHERNALTVEYYERPDIARREWAEALPDLTDPATVGCLRAMVEVDGRVVVPWVPVNSSAVWWRLERLTGNIAVRMPVASGFGFIAGPTLLEALVEALEHAPAVVTP